MSPIDYLSEFPIEASELPNLLKEMLSPGTNTQNDLLIEIAKIKRDIENPSRESCTMVMVTSPEGSVISLNDYEHYCIDLFKPYCDRKGDLSDYGEFLGKNEVLVVRSGSDASFVTCSLSEKVSLILGLCPRFLSKNNEIIYDHLLVPQERIAEGQQIYEPGKNQEIVWKMRNDYLQHYLWARGHIGIKVFCYTSFLEESAQIRNLMGGERFYNTQNNWYNLHLQEIQGKLFLDVKAVVVAIFPKNTLDGGSNGLSGKLIWPGASSPIVSYQMNPDYPDVYISDNFLIKYENNNLYKVSKIINCPDGKFSYGISFKEWSFHFLERVGRNFLKIRSWDLYRNCVPAQVMLHAHENAVDPAVAINLIKEDNHILQKTKKFILSIVELGKWLFRLSCRLKININKIPEDFVKFSETELNSNGIERYPVLCRLASVAPWEMSRSEFLSRCKTLHECLDKIDSNLLKAFLRILALTKKQKTDLESMKSLKLLQSIKNIVDFLNKQKNSVETWLNSENLQTWDEKSPCLTALCLNNELRQIAAHEKSDDDFEKLITKLTDLGFDSCSLRCGWYGAALDFMFDEVTKSINAINSALSRLLNSDHAILTNYHVVSV